MCLKVFGCVSIKTTKQGGGGRRLVRLITKSILIVSLVLHVVGV